MSSVSMQKRLLRALNLRRAFRLVWTAAPGWTAVNLVLLVVQGLLPMVALLLLKQIVDALTTVIASPELGFAEVLFWIVLAGLAGLAGAAANALGTLAAEAQGVAVTDHVADVIHAKSVAVDLGYYETPEFHDTLQRAQEEAAYRSSRIVNGLKQTLQNALVLVGIVGLFCAFHWGVGLALLVAALPAALVRVGHARRQFDFEQTQVERERQAWYYHWLLIDPDYARELRLYGIGGLFSERFRTLRATLRGERLTLLRQRALWELVAQLLVIVVLFSTLAAMAYAVVRGGVTLGVMVMYFQGYQRALSALQAVIQGLGWLYEDNLFLRHFSTFLDLPSSVEQADGRRDLPAPATTGLTCRDLYFTYPSRTAPTLRGIDLDIRPGEIVALVGANGAGKTTLAKLLCRLYDPDGGSISWEGIDLRTFATATWRRQISVLSQDYARFDLSLGENIWLGDIERAADRVALADAARLAGVDAVLEQFPAGFDTRLGTQFRDGQELSIGEWQRVALARTWFRDAQLVILDEPSSALDPLAEAAMIERFRSLIGRRSALLISHRLATVRLADRIYVIDDGRTVESGSHAELLARDGLYARLFRAQAGHYAEFV